MIRYSSPATTHNIRRDFIGGSDARIIMGEDEKALIRLWQEKPGEVGLEDLSTDLIVQLGLVTEEPGHAMPAVKRRVKQPVIPWLAATLDGVNEAAVSDGLPALLSQPDPRTAAILVEELDSGLSECGLDLLSSVGTAAQKTILGFKPLDRGDRDPGSYCQLLL
jgi:hypothetical protein